MAPPKPTPTPSPSNSTTTITLPASRRRTLINTPVRSSKDTLRPEADEKETKPDLLKKVTEFHPETMPPPPSPHRNLSNNTNQKESSPPAARQSPRPALKTSMEPLASPDDCASCGGTSRKRKISAEVEEMIGSFQAEYKRALFKEAMKAMSSGEDLGGSRERIEEVRGFFRECVERLVEDADVGF
ncbi:hypothetical protein BJ508DRAFT_374661 [Ascobolus immersus RN42]|uniref:Uncharacterized protein n=1 Tax=Ascobolus immersus RN42 TaxID=1160509 RepID=A0A3N4ID74_ASCIM|nr:hypothetical protein BJ508DRAFT_374661 [Ascobolus immersus RN42]